MDRYAAGNSADPFLHPASLRVPRAKGKHRSALSCGNPPATWCAVSGGKSLCRCCATRSLAGPSDAGGLVMFVRKVSVRLKSNTLKQFTNLMESEILPWLRMQEGFLDLITLAVTGGSEIQALSFWDHEGNAQAFNTSRHPTVLKILESLLDGVPRVKTFEVVSSTVKEFSLHGRETRSNLTPIGSEALGDGSQEAAV